MIRRNTRFEPTAGLVMAVASGIAFGTLGILAKIAYEHGAESLALLAARFTVSVLLLVGVHLALRRPLLINKRAIVRLLLLGGLGYGFEAALFFLALERAPAGIVGLIFYSYPMWTNVIGLLTGLERFHGRVVIALVLGTVGVASIFTIEGIGVAGPLLALCAAVAVGVYLLLAQIVMRDIDPIHSALWTSVGATLTVGIAALLSNSTLPDEAWPQVAGLGLASALAFVLLYAAIARIGAGRSSIANMVEPVTTVLLAAAILGEPLTLRIAIGAALVVSALPVLASVGRREVETPSELVAHD